MRRKTKIVLASILGISSVAASGVKSNPPVTAKVAWDTPTTAELFQRSCSDCHSHSSAWPWYSHFAPVSWLLIHNVKEGREHFNVSSGELGDVDEVGEVLLEDEMPPSEYLLLHPGARLSLEEKNQLIHGLEQTFDITMSEGDSGDHERGRDDD